MSTGTTAPYRTATLLGRRTVPRREPSLAATSSTATAREQKEKNRKIEGRKRDSRRQAEGKYRERGRTTSSVLRKPPTVLFAQRQQQHRHCKSASTSFIFLFSFSACNLHCSRF